MPIKSKIYSVKSLEENSYMAIRVISPEILSNNKVGFESTKNEISLYRIINGKNLSADGAESLLKEELRISYYSQKGDYNDYTSNQIFWFRLYNSISECGAEITGLGSEKRKRIIDSTQLTADVILQQVWSMVLGPHFNEYLAKRIVEEGYDKIILNLGRAKIVADKTKSELVKVNTPPRFLQEICENMEREYRLLTDSARSLLPDLRD